MFGRPAASVPTFPYSESLKKSGVTWDSTSLDKWLTDPDAFVTLFERHFDSINRRIAPCPKQPFSGQGSAQLETPEARFDCGVFTRPKNLAADAPPGPVWMYKKSADLCGVPKRIEQAIFATGCTVAAEVPSAYLAIVGP